jgi:uncharacterized RDD family membrane protein YckC
MTQPESPQEQSPADQEEIWRSDPPAEDPAKASPGQPGVPPSSFAQTLTSTAPSPGPAGFYYADLPNRIIAYVIDVILLAVFGFILAIVLGGLFGGMVSAPTLDSAGGDLNIAAFVVVSLTQLGVSFAYFGYFWTASRGTPGMKLLGLQIGDQSDGHSIDWNQAFIRWLILGIPSILSTFASFVSSGLSLVLTVIGLAWLIILLYSIAQSPTKQGIHDRYARTILVKSGRRAA